MIAALYNEIEPFAAQWLRNLVAAGHVAAGGVEERSIRELRAEDVRDVTQFHTFAGIGVWSYALKLAGWPDSRPVWTGSCPCQPFSAAGKRAGTADPRHLWPEWFRLIRECRPPVIFGEQVASAGDWLDLVSSDLEAEGYAFGAAVLGAHSVGAPHIRQRIYWVAYANEAGFSLKRGGGLLDGEREAYRNDAHGRGQNGLVAYSAESRRDAGRPGEARDGRDEAREQPPGLRDAGELGDAGREGLPERERNGSIQREALGAHEGQAAERGSDASFWSDAEWIPCRDGKLRPVEPGTFPLAHGAASRVGRLRAYGNALNAEQAATFIRAAIAGRP